MLAIYWLSLFIGTHLPRVPQVLAEQGDKTLHFCAYAGLASLLLAWRISCGLVSMRTVLLLFVIVAAYGVMDETTQPLVGRFCDLEDWIADIMGASIAMAVTWPVAARWLRFN